MSYNPFENAQEQFDRVADILQLEQSSRDLLRQPLKEFHFTIPVKMDDGTTKDAQNGHSFFMTILCRKKTERNDHYSETRAYYQH